MNRSRLSLVSVCCVLLLAGCGGGNAPQPASQPTAQTKGHAVPDTAAQPSTHASTPPTPPAKSEPAVAAKLALKPLSELKIPEGLADPPTESKSPKSGWDFVSRAQPGDWIEMELAQAQMRIEAFDVADHGIVQVSDVTFKVSDEVTKSKSVIKNLFTEPELDPSDERYVRFEKKPSQRKFEIDGQEVVADTEIEGYKQGKLINRAWTSRQVPLGTLQSEDAEGKVQSRLVRFGPKR